MLEQHLAWNRLPAPAHAKDDDLVTVDVHEALVHLQHGVFDSREVGVSQLRTLG